MSRRGPYVKGVAKREEILTAALAVVSDVGYGRTTFREIAEAAGATPAAITYYFGSKENLFIEIIRRRDELETQAYSPGATDDPRTQLSTTLVRLLRHRAEVPGLLQLGVRFGMEASDPDHPAHESFRARVVETRSTTEAGLRNLQNHGGLGASVDVERLTVVLLALIEGLQAQWLYDPSVDMGDAVGYLIDLVTNQSGNS